MPTICNQFNSRSQDLLLQAPLARATSAGAFIDDWVLL
jgi:hypothetical protein